MKIGELSRATKASTRSLRYYEELGLIRSERRANGYRDYDQATVATVTTIKSLIGLGFPTAVIAEVLACETGGLPDDCAAVRSRVAEIRDEMDVRARQLIQQRDALSATLVQTSFQPIAS